MLVMVAVTEQAMVFAATITIRIVITVVAIVYHVRSWHRIGGPTRITAAFVAVAAFSLTFTAMALRRRRRSVARIAAEAAHETIVPH